MILKRSKPKSKSKSGRHTTKEIKQQPISKIGLPFKFTRWTIFYAVLALIFCAGVSALVIQHNLNKPIHIITSPTSNTEDNNCMLSSSGCPNSGSLSTSTPNSNNTPTQPAQSSNPSTTTKPSPNSTQQDSNGCTPGTDSYQQCTNSVNYINLMDKCDNEMSAADDALMAVVNPAKTTYNTDITNGDQQAESVYPAGSDTLAEVEYNIMNGEITKYNNTVAPAWATYQSSYNTIDSQGCNISMTYSEYIIMMSAL